MKEEKKKEYVKLVYEAAFVMAGMAIILVNIFYVSVVFPFIGPVINVAGAMVAIVPPFLMFYERYRRAKDVEEQFILFITDLTESINSGMTLPIALRHCTNRDYRSLDPYVKEIYSKVDWGVPFEEALSMFANKVNSIPIRRSVSTIIQTYKVGGKISDTLKAIGQSLIEINKIKQERSASVQSQIVTSYMIFFVFIFILITLQTFLIPALSTSSESASLNQVIENTGEDQSKLFSEAFMNFIIIQGIFAGLATGKMAEGSVVAGFKHSLVLTTVGYTLFSIFSQFHIAMF